MVISPRHGIPFVICEAVSGPDVSDRNRMLTQAIALARVGQHLLRFDSKKTFFVVAICVDAHMCASRFIVMQTERGDPEGAEQQPVSEHGYIGTRHSTKCIGVDSPERL